MSKEHHVIIYDQDCIVGDMLIYALQNTNCRITRLRGNAARLIDQLLKQKADLLIANSGPNLGNLLHLLRCCRAKYPQQKQILITAAWNNLDEMLKGEKIEAVPLKPFKLSQIKEIIENLLPEERPIAQMNWRKKLLGVKRWIVNMFQDLKPKNVLEGIKQKLKRLWRCWLLKSIEDERLQMFKLAYHFCQSKFASHKGILDLWLYLEFLERCYLLAKCGVNVERDALQFYYATLRSKLERGLCGWAVSLKGGDGLGPELDSAQFSKFYYRLKNKELSFSCFIQAAQARLVRWALSRPSAVSIHKMLKKTPLTLRKTSSWQSLSDKRRIEQLKAEAEILALNSTNEHELKEVFQKVWC